VLPVQPVGCSMLKRLYSGSDGRCDNVSATVTARESADRRTVTALISLVPLGAISDGGPGGQWGGQWMSDGYTVESGTGLKSR
jgi:hypothetical protein